MPALLKFFKLPVGDAAEFPIPTALFNVGAPRILQHEFLLDFHKCSSIISLYSYLEKKGDIS
jgi:hypothetical protein